MSRDVPFLARPTVILIRFLRQGIRERALPAGVTIATMLRSFIAKFSLGVFSALLAVVLVYNIPIVHQHLAWRVDFTMTYLRMVLSPAGALPAPRAEADQPAPPPLAIPSTPTVLPSPEPTAAVSGATALPPTPTPTALPAAVQLTPPKFEQQGINNCGPATLSAYLRYYGWDGNQSTIADVVKPVPEDRNVNVEELQYFVHTKVGWLNFEYRVGMDVDRLKRFLAAGLPVMIEEGMRLDQSYWPNDDLWAGHYLFITGYNEASKIFITQDSYYGPNRAVPYATLDRNWETFNRVLILIYHPEMQDLVKSILGADWDRDANRQHALATAQAGEKADPQDAYAWFNAGTNLVYFERYPAAADSYDQARRLGLPQRMLRYQFGPFIAYFHTGRIQDLLDITNYALHVTPNSEEATLWKGWALYRSGDRAGAEAQFKRALSDNPSYQDAKYALNFLASN